MHFSTLLSTVLLAFPATIMAGKDCTHYEVNYYVTAAILSDLPTYDEAFRHNRKLFKNWASRTENGGGCGGWCQDQVQVPNVKSRTWTYTMRCVAPRMRKTAGRPPDGEKGLFAGYANRKCLNVNCVNNNAAFVKQDCDFTYGSCKCTGCSGKK